MLGVSDSWVGGVNSVVDVIDDDAVSVVVVVICVASEDAADCVGSNGAVGSCTQSVQVLPCVVSMVSVIDNAKHVEISVIGCLMKHVDFISMIHTRLSISSRSFLTLHLHPASQNVRRISRLC